MNIAAKKKKINHSDLKKKFKKKMYKYIIFIFNFIYRNVKRNIIFICMNEWRKKCLFNGYWFRNG